MATVANPFDTGTENEDPNTNGQGQTTLSGESANTSGVPNSPPQLQSAAGGSTIDGSASSSPQGTKSGSYTNLSKYMQANQNFNQDQGGVAGQLVSGINQYTPNIQGAASAFDSATQPIQNQYAQGQAAVQQAVSDPVAAVQNQDLFNQVTGARTASYTGPQSLSDLSGPYNYNNLQNQTNNYNSLVNAGQSEAGRYNLLSQMFNKPSYTTGQQSLDNLLVQSNPDQMQQLTGLRQNAAQTQQQLNFAQANAKGVAQNLAGQAQALNASANSELGGAMNSLTSGLQNTINSDIASNQQTQADLASGKITKAEAQQLGLDTSGIANLYGVDPTQYLNFQTPTMSTVATPQQQAQFAALSQLSGKNNTIMPDATQAGTYGTTSPLNNANLMSAITAQQNAYNAQADQYQNAMNAEQRDLGYKQQEQINSAAQALAQATGLPASQYGYVNLPNFQQYYYNGQGDKIAPSLTNDQINSIFSGYTRQAADGSENGGSVVPQMVIPVSDQTTGNLAQNIFGDYDRVGSALQQQIAAQQAALKQIQSQYNNFGKGITVT